MEVTQRIVANAAKYFREGNYQEALSLYQQAAKYYDARFFSANIALCQWRINGTRPAESIVPGSPAESRRLSKQLDETQGLLERYYRRCQELEYQLMETATS